MQNLAYTMSKPYQFQFVEGTLINRVEVNKTLADIVSRKKLTVVLGQRQAGKSILVKNFLDGKKNVYVQHLVVGAEIKKACGIFDMDAIAATLRMLKTTPEEPALVVFEMVHSQKDDEIISIYEAMKTIVYDRELPNIRGILVLSNHYAIDSFPRDHGRYETIWIGDLTTEEAKEYIKSKKPDANATAYIEAGGLHLSQLQEAIEAASLGDWKEGVKQRVAQAKRQPDVVQIMRVLPKLGADFDYLVIANLTKSGDDMIRMVRSDTRRTVLYSAGPDLFHWASPSHYSAFHELPSGFRDEL